MTDYDFENMTDYMTQYRTHWNRMQIITKVMNEHIEILQKELSQNVITPTTLRDLAEGWVNAGDILNQINGDLHNIFNAQTEIMTQMKADCADMLNDIEKYIKSK